MKETSGEDRGFKIADKRRFAGKEGSVDFSTFIYSLATSALFHLGDVPDPQTSKKEKNLPMVKHTIDIIGMLKEKTKGNLTNEEAMLIDELLYTLRMRYLNETG